MNITRPTRDSYRIDLTASEFTALNYTFSAVRTGFINWLQRKGKRVQDQNALNLRHSAELSHAFGKGLDLDVTPVTSKPTNDHKGQLIARIGAFCGTLSEGNITDKQADICKAAAFALISFAQESAILSGDECEKWGNAINAAAAYGIARTRANA